MCGRKEVLGIKQGDKEKENKAKQFMTVTEREWSMKIAITADASIKERQPITMITEEQLPIPEDIQKFTTFVKN